MANFIADAVTTNRFSMTCCFAMPWVAAGVNLGVMSFSPVQACEFSTVTNMNKINVAATRIARANR